jgi:ligand-binding SRPBCC domain-containing protein
MAFYQFKREQFIQADLATVWDFISSPANLKKITPPYMGFDITSGDLPEKMYQGMIISYKVSPFWGIKTDWVTEITHIKELEYFVDEQRMGPYALWHHQHMAHSSAKWGTHERYCNLCTTHGFFRCYCQ